VQGLAYGSATPEQLAVTRASWGAAEVIGSVVVLGLVVAAYLYFSFWLS
jgi:SSS family solute:Na+ symporter